MNGLDVPHKEMWRRQCARNLMDCYVLGVSAEVAGAGARRSQEALARLMAEGMMRVRPAADEKAFYRAAAARCRECAAAAAEEQSGLFRIYAEIFEEMGGEADRRGGKT